VLLENLRFHPEEEKNDETFARELATLGDVYVKRRLRRRASRARVGGGDRALPSGGRPPACSWRTSFAISARPSAIPRARTSAVLGGAKVRNKIEVIEN